MMWKFNEFLHNTAVITENGELLTYQELDALSVALFKNINKRSLIFCLCKNDIGSLAGYVSCLNNKVVPLMLIADIPQELLENLMDVYKPEFIYLPQRELDRFSSPELVFSHLGYSLIKTKYNQGSNLNDYLALLITTSGSTGSPKLVRQSYKNIEANTKSIVEYLKITESEKAITTLPMNYTYGLSIINSHLWAGGTIILTEKTLMQKEFWQQIKEYEATSIAGVPYTYEMLDKLKIFKMDLPALRTMTQAGGKLSPELHLKFAKWGEENNKQFIIMYGQTEATARMAYLPVEKNMEKIGSMGLAIPGGRFHIIDDKGDRIDAPGMVGELVYEGDNVTLGYAEACSDLAKGDEFNGKLLTGDMVKADADGFYYIVGRKKRFLKIFGNRLNLDEIERLIKEKFSGIECACCGLDDKMYIFITNDQFINQLVKFVTNITRLYHGAFKIKIIGEIPKNESGKTQYLELNKYYD